ncbi:TetR/AcrR family transcriptional regulator, partial [Catenuloplanes japonicus]|uniref:TetR/AcrR family transcriptional regulator n=1 Tax=Catenuloplanes japonicus TaxID=33876 RepID=UPI00052620AB
MRGLRSDAELNRERIMAAAQDVFSEAGLDVSVDRIARRAGVSVATLYRRFPTKQALIDDVFADRFSRCTVTWEAAAADPDPWRAFTTLIMAFSEAQVRDRTFSAVLIAHLADAIRNPEVWESLHLTDLVARIKATGRLRADFGMHDLLLLVTGNAGVIAAAGPQAVDASRRYIATMLRGFQA